MCWNQRPITVHFNSKNESINHDITIDKNQSMIQCACNENNKHEYEVQKVPRGGVGSEGTRCAVTRHRQSSLFDVADQSRCRAGVRCAKANAQKQTKQLFAVSSRADALPKNLIALNSVQSLKEDGVSEACSSSKSVRPDLLERRCYGCNKSVETSAESSPKP